MTFSFRKKSAKKYWLVTSYKLSTILRGRWMALADDVDNNSDIFLTFPHFQLPVNCLRLCKFPAIRHT